MASETKCQNVGNKVPVALPKGEPALPSPPPISQDMSLQQAIGARVRISTSLQKEPSVEGTVYTADPLTNLLVLNTSPSSQAATITPTTLTAPPGSYRIIPFNQISSFQVLDLAQPSTSSQTPSLASNALNTSALQSRLTNSLQKAQEALLKQGPKGTTPTDQALFDGLNKTLRARWSGAQMIVADTYVIEKPYTPATVRLVEGRHGDLDRMRKVVDMERSKAQLRSGQRDIDGKMNVGSGSGIGGQGDKTAPKKGG